jgi:hypothetical protein
VEAVAPSVTTLHVTDDDTTLHAVCLTRCCQLPLQETSSTDDDVTIARYCDHDSRSQNSAAILLSRFGSGRVGLCGVNVEVTYADVAGVCPGLIDSVPDLRDCVYNRDFLLLDILNKLGVV